MATSSSSLPCEDQFLCSICLGVFEDPVSTPCGHNFCKACVTGYWDTTVVYPCPLCKTTFEVRPDLRVNTLLSELAAQSVAVAVTDGSSSGPDQTLSTSGEEVVCDVCTHPKLAATKSCMECQTSYCGTHLEPHQRVRGLLKHTLIDPVENLVDMMCQQHDRLLTWFCRGHLAALCDICVLSHGHTQCIVPLHPEAKKKRAKLELTHANVPRKISQRLQKMQEFEREVAQSQECHLREVAGIAQEFSSLMSAVEETKAELIGAADRRQKEVEQRAQDHILHLEKEINEIRTISTGLKELLDTRDNVKVLQSYPNAIVFPRMKEWSDITARGELGTEPMLQSSRRSMDQLRVTVGEMVKEMASLCQGTDTPIADRRTACQGTDTPIADTPIIDTPTVCQRTDTPITDTPIIDTPTVYQRTDRSMITVFQRTDGPMPLAAPIPFDAVRRYAVNVVLNPSTACPTLVLSDDLKQVRFRNPAQGPLKRTRHWKCRFSKMTAVLGQTGFSSGKFYFEVWMGYKTEWIIGVAKESIDRKACLPRHPDSGLWALVFINGDGYEAFSDPGVPVYWKKARKVGVFVDHEGGHVLFYDVEAGFFMHAFSGCRFTEKLYPYLNPCDKLYGGIAAPLVITPISHTG